jgi:leucyl/phenylalanyl-tRNA--protein transferase
MSILPPSEFFPPAETADADGLIGFGGKLSPEWLLDAYRHGIFPWPLGDPGTPLAWWSPDPRAIIELDRFHVPRRLARTCRSGRFQVTCDQDFASVIRGCATARGRSGQTWLTEEMIEAYIRLFSLGHAHSVEAWHGGQLVGGTYGVSTGGLFAAESKFYLLRDASKVALAHLLSHLRVRGYLLFDIQQYTLHTVQFGAIKIRRREYLRRLATALARPTTFGDRLESDLA